MGRSLAQRSLSRLLGGGGRTEQLGGQQVFTSRTKKKSSHGAKPRMGRPPCGRQDGTMVRGNMLVDHSESRWSNSENRKCCGLKIQDHVLNTQQDKEGVFSFCPRDVRL